MGNTALPLPGRVVRFFTQSVDKLRERLRFEACLISNKDVWGHEYAPLHDNCWICFLATQVALERA